MWCLNGIWNECCVQQYCTGQGIFECLTLLLIAWKAGRGHGCGHGRGRGGGRGRGRGRSGGDDDGSFLIHSLIESKRRVFALGCPYSPLETPPNPTRASFRTIHIGLLSPQADGMEYVTAKSPTEVPGVTGEEGVTSRGAVNSMISIVYGAFFSSFFFPVFFCVFVFLYVMW